MIQKAAPHSKALRCVLAVLLAIGLMPVLGTQARSAWAEESFENEAAPYGEEANRKVPGADETTSDPEAAGGPSGDAADPAASPQAPAGDSAEAFSARDASADEPAAPLAADPAIDLTQADRDNSYVEIDGSSVTVGTDQLPHEGSVTFTTNGEQVATKFVIRAAFSGTVYLDNANLSAANDTNIKLEAGAVVDLKMAGGNKIANSSDTAKRLRPVIEVPAGAELTLSGETGSTADSLSVEASHVRANSSAALFSAGAVIGSADSANSGPITIQNVELSVRSHVENTDTATTMSPGAVHSGAVIGSGSLGVADDIAIENAIVNIDVAPVVAGSKASGSVWGALIGSGANNTMNSGAMPVTVGDITIENSQVTATAKAAQGENTGAVIGSGGYGSVGGKILLAESSVRAVTASSGTAFAAAIGSGRYGSVAAIEIQGGEVFAVAEGASGTYGAGIGTGQGRDDTTNRVSIGSILIDGNAIVNAASQVPRDSATTLFDTGMNLPVPASGSASGAGIGGGRDADAPSIIINSGTVKAASLAGSVGGSSFAYAPGIGAGGLFASGKGGVLGELAINGGYIEATSSGWIAQSHAVGAGAGSNLKKGKVVITGGTVFAKSKPFSPTSSNGRDGIGAGEVIIDGGSVYSELGRDRDATIIGYGEANWKNSQGDLVFPSLLRTGVASGAVTAGAIDGIPCATAPSAGVYGINDAVTTADGEVCFWMPETATGVEGSVDLTLDDAGTAKGYAIDYLRNSSGDRNYYDSSSWNAYIPSPMAQYAIVSFESNTADTLADQRVVVGEQAAEPAGLTNGDLVLVGWFTDDAFTDKWNFATPVTASMTLHAKWEAAPTVLKVARLFGADRYATSKEVAAYGRDLATAKTLIVASGGDDHFPDALAASSLSGATEAPIVLTQPDHLGASARDAIASAAVVEKIYIIGSTASVTADVEGAIRELHPSAEIERLGGPTRQATAELICDELGDEASKTAILARSMDFPDSLSISPWAAITRSPIFLSGFSEQRYDQSTIDAIVAGGFERILVVGDENAVPEAAVDEVLAATGLSEGSVVRFDGVDREHTSLLVAEWATDPARDPGERLSFDKLAVTRSDVHADALAGGALQGFHKAVILLAPSTWTHPDVLAAIIEAEAEAGIGEIRFFGDENSLDLRSVRDYIRAIAYDQVEWAPDSSVEIDLS